MEECVNFSKVQAEACNFTKISTPPGCFSCFLNCTNCSKSRNALHIVLNLVFNEMILSMLGHLQYPHNQVEVL